MNYKPYKTQHVRVCIKEGRGPNVLRSLLHVLLKEGFWRHFRPHHFGLFHTIWLETSSVESLRVGAPLSRQEVLAELQNNIKEIPKIKSILKCVHAPSVILTFIYT